MHILQLNDMRSSKVENLTPIARAETKKILETFMEKEKTDLYSDDRWQKNYRQGGPLEWYNPPFSMNAHILNVGSADEWAATARREFEETIMRLPEK